jgi:hypothetical protein
MDEKMILQLKASIIMIIVGCILLIAGFCVPPLGEIDSSVLVAFGEIMTFVGAIFGIDYSYKKRKKGQEDEE